MRESTMKRRFVWLLLMAALLLGACATDQPQNSGNKPFPRPPSAGQALVFFYIERYDPVKSQPTLYIDGDPIVELPGNSYSWVYVKPGLHAVRTMWGHRDAGMNAHIMHEFKAGESAFLKCDTTALHFGPFYNVSGEVRSVSPETAYRGIQNATYRRPRREIIE